MSVRKLHCRVKHHLKKTFLVGEGVESINTRYYKKNFWVILIINKQFQKFMEVSSDSSDSI